ncbi:MAG: hypothetical protein P8K07_15720 [Candidatus Binatia bacterium]|nr:hypothetical protein [Candidatus Binatia bacterium]
MDPVVHASRKKAGLRRARREDIHALIQLTSGPIAGRVRALRRLLKTLVADVYIHNADGEINGCVAILYRRSLQHGGLTATIDSLNTTETGSLADEVRAKLLALALDRARRRGCVAIDCATDDPALSSAIAATGFQPGGTHWVTSLRKDETE